VTENNANNNPNFTGGMANKTTLSTGPNIKHHSAAQHVNIRKEFLTPYIVLEMIRLKQVAAKAA
jgi:hypothetical protein